MSALEGWKQRETGCRNARQRPDEEMGPRLARWYDEWVAHNDYVDIIGIYERRRVAPVTIDANRNLSDQNGGCATRLSEAVRSDRDDALDLFG